MASGERRNSAGTQLPLPQKFFHYFQHEVTALQDEMSRLADTSLVAGERADATDHCFAGIARLSSEVKDASSYLPAYDQRTYAEAIKALQEKLAETKQTFQPRQKFSFRTARKSPSAISLSDAADLAEEKQRQALHNTSPGNRTPDSTVSATPNYLRTPPNEKSSDPTNNPVLLVPQPSSLSHVEAPSPTEESPGPTELRPAIDYHSTSVSISNESDKHLMLPSATLTASTPCNLSQLDSCVVDLSIPTTAETKFASLTVNKVSKSLLVCGTVSGPAHITGVNDSVIVVTCRQFRMHECENVDVYLHCSSRPIIEDCSKIRFTQIPKPHIELADSGEPSETHGKNLWDQVDDFKWLKSEPSPNWSTLPAEDLIPEETWRDIVPGGPGWSLGDILLAVKIKK